MMRSTSFHFTYLLTYLESSAQLKSAAECWQNTPAAQRRRLVFIYAINDFLTVNLSAPHNLGSAELLPGSYDLQFNTATTDLPDYQSVTDLRTRLTQARTA